MKMTFACTLAAVVALAHGTPAFADDDFITSGKLLLTGGVTNIEGAGGGGISTWSVITGYETRDGIGANAHFTYVPVQRFSLRDYGASVGFFDRLELSYAREDFDTGSTGPLLGLPSGFTFSQNVYGAKVRLFGNLVYDQDTRIPQISAGVQFKENNRGAIIQAVGGKHAAGTDYYVTATKLFLDHNLLVDATLRETKANQTGLLGFGGNKHDDYSTQFEGAVGYLLTRKIVVGAEYRTKPSNLGFAKEQNWFDIYGAYAFNRNISGTIAYANLGSIATFRNQQGPYVSIQAGF